MDSDDLPDMHDPIDPIVYARRVLGVELTPEQERTIRQVEPTELRHRQVGHDVRELRFGPARARY